MMTVFGRLAAPLLVGVSVSCSSIDVAGPRTHELLGDGVPIPVVRLGGEDRPLTFSSGYAQPVRLVIRDESALRQAWSQIWAGQNPPPALPTIDFAEHMVVVAAMGSRPSGGYSILIQNARGSAADVELTVLTSSPGPACGVTAALTSPVDAVVLPRAGAVHFREESATISCES